VLFPFGFGLSYTTYKYSGLTVRRGKIVKVSFTIANTGAREGAEIAEVYAALPAKRPGTAQAPRRIQQGEARRRRKQTVTIDIDPKYLSIFDVKKNA
jgi:beta-glucosidase